MAVSMHAALPTAQVCKPTPIYATLCACTCMDHSYSKQGEPLFPPLSGMCTHIK